MDIINPFNDLCTLIVYQKDSRDPRSKGHDYRECRRRYLRTAANGISSKKERYNRMNNLAEAILQKYTE